MNAIPINLRKLKLQNVRRDDNLWLTNVNDLFFQMPSIIPLFGTYIILSVLEQIQ